jgi:polyhydroxybutyrate depolymerase
LLDKSFECQNGHCRVPDEVDLNECPMTTLAVGDNERTVQVGDTTRSYLVRVPEIYTGTTAVPLVLDFHPLSGNAATAAASSGYRELAEQEGFIAAYPEGIDAAWNIGPCCTESREVDDVAFARALVEQLQSEACVDPKRVYAVGAVMGGGMAYHLACNAADVFAGIAPSSFDLLAEQDQPCQPTEPVAVISFRNTGDMVVPYEGGAEPAPNLPGVTMNYLGAVATFESWAELNQCTGAPSVPDADGCSTYSDCADEVEVSLCTTEASSGLGSAADGWAMLQRHSQP